MSKEETQDNMVLNHPKWPQFGLLMTASVKSITWFKHFFVRTNPKPNNIVSAAGKFLRREGSKPSSQAKLPWHPGQKITPLLTMFDLVRTSV